MAGKGTLIVIIGYTILFGMTGKYWTRVASSSVDNFLQYYDETNAHSIAEAAANLGGNRVFTDKAASQNLSLSGSLSGGGYTLDIRKVNVNQLLLTATGTYPYGGGSGSTTDTIRVLFGPTYFSTFGLYTKSMNNLSWDTGDTLWGSFHSDSTFNVEGNPVFYGRVTCSNGMTGSGTPSIYGSFISGLSIPMTSTAISDIQTAASSGGFILNNPSSPAPFDVYMKISSNGTVTYHTNLRTTDTTVSISTYAPNGLIFVNNGNLHVNGWVSGKLTVAAAGSQIYGLGNVYIDGNLQCHTDPSKNVTSPDMIGVVAQNNVIVESDYAYLGYSSTHPPNDPIIEAALYAHDGSFQCYYRANSSYTNLGGVHVFGSIANYSLGVTSDPTGTYGYKPDYKFDPRMSNTAPPFYPVSGAYSILSWEE